VSTRIFAAVIVSITSPYALSAAGDCASYLQWVNYDVKSTLNQTQQYNLNKANFCSYEYDKATQAQQAQISASYEAFSGNASGSSSNLSEKQKQLCQDHYGEYWFNQLGIQTEKNVSDRAIDAVNHCIDAENLGLKTTFVASGDATAITISGKWGGSAGTAIRGVVRNPAKDIQCITSDGKSTDSIATSWSGKKLMPNDSIVISCTRSYVDDVVNGEKVSCLPDGQVTLDVAGAPYTVNFFRRCKTDFLLSKAKQVDDKVSGLETKLNSLQATVSANQQTETSDRQQIGGRVSALEGASRFIFTTTAGNCPQGWKYLARSLIGAMPADLSAANAAGMDTAAVSIGGYNAVHPVLCQKQ
jgi:uncharacterized protein YcfL